MTYRISKNYLSKIQREPIYCGLISFVFALLFFGSNFENLDSVKVLLSISILILPIILCIYSTRSRLSDLKNHKLKITENTLTFSHRGAKIQYNTDQVSKIKLVKKGAVIKKMKLFTVNNDKYDLSVYENNEILFKNLKDLFPQEVWG